MRKGKNLIEGDEYEGLAEHTEVDLVDIAELVGEHQEEHHLGEGGEGGKGEDSGAGELGSGGSPGAGR